MANVFDVAAYILEKQCPKEGGTITTWKLQKLVYYSQAWHAVWHGKPLFGEEIQAWANGPVCPELYGKHRGYYAVNEKEIGGDSSKLTDDEKKSIDIVLESYGDKTSQWLSDLTHMEDPWKKARVGLPDNERGTNAIKIEDMIEYYESLPPA